MALAFNGDDIEEDVDNLEEHPRDRAYFRKELMEKMTFLGVFFRGLSATKILFFGPRPPDGEAAAEIVCDPDVSLSIVDRGDGLSGIILGVPGVACESRLLIIGARLLVAAWIINMIAVVEFLCPYVTLIRK